MPLGIDQELMRQLMETFAIELEEQLQTVTDGLLALEKGVAGDERRKVLEGVFRAAHNIKGAARGVEVNDVSDIAHHLESAFAVLKRDNQPPAAAVTDLALESLDSMRQAMLAFRAQQPLGFDKAALLARLEGLVAALETQGAGQLPAAAVTEAAVPVAAKATAPVPAAAPPVASAPATRKPPEPPAPAAGAEPRSGPADEVVRVNLEKLENLAALMEELQVTKIEMDDHLASVQQLRQQVQELSANWRRTGADGATRPSSPLHDNGVKRNADSVTRLDLASVQVQREMRSSISRLSILVESLQDNVRMMRLVPVATLLRPMTRSVRDIARELGKKVQFETSGDEIEIDRMVLEGVRDPLVHLLRNALDHGIESPEHRRSQGKPEEGRLQVTVQSEGSQIVMTVRDDGGGISAERIAASARKKKLVSETELAAMGRDDILNLIFRPGFSSKDVVTNISGRGVGLDVVVANLRKLKGSVLLETEEGRGTRFILRLPITLATDHGVMVRAGGSVFAIPTSAVDRVMEIRSDQIIEVEASHAILHRGRTIPLRDLAATLELASAPAAAPRTLPVVVIAKGWDNVAFLVDEIMGEREMVVKPLRPPLLAVRNVTGGTLTGSGEVIMVLSPSDLVDSAMRSGLPRLQAVAAGAEEAPVLRVLVVDDSITTRNLEKSILEHAGYQVSVAVDGQQAWQLLQREPDFSLVITDVEMPEMDGLELTRLIKQSEKFSRLPVIVVTSLANEADRRRGVEVGADAYIVKGQFETKMLLDVVQQII